MRRVESRVCVCVCVARGAIVAATIPVHWLVLVPANPAIVVAVAVVGVVAAPAAVRCPRTGRPAPAVAGPRVRWRLPSHPQRFVGGGSDRDHQATEIGVSADQEIMGVRMRTLVRVPIRVRLCLCGCLCIPYAPKAVESHCVARSYVRYGRACVCAYI